MNRIRHYQNNYNQWCTDVWIDGLYSCIPEYLTLEQAMEWVKTARKSYIFKD